MDKLPRASGSGNNVRTLKLSPPARLRDGSQSAGMITAPDCLGGFSFHADFRREPLRPSDAQHERPKTMAEATDDRLRLLIERIERLEEEKKGIGDDITAVYAEAKATGYDPKIMRQIVRLRKMKPDDRSEQETVLDVYKSALGMG